MKRRHFKKYIDNVLIIYIVASNENVQQGEQNLRSYIETQTVLNSVILSFANNMV
jgi:hypothetical protein